VAGIVRRWSSFGRYLPTMSPRLRQRGLRPARVLFLRLCVRQADHAGHRCSRRLGRCFREVAVRRSRGCPERRCESSPAKDYYRARNREQVEYDVARRSLAASQTHGRRIQAEGSATQATSSHPMERIWPGTVPSKSQGGSSVDRSIRQRTPGRASKLRARAD
jgi:hypothetical protein